MTSSNIAVIQQAVTANQGAIQGRTPTNTGEWIDMRAAAENIARSVAGVMQGASPAEAAALRASPAFQQAEQLVHAYERLVGDHRDDRQLNNSFNGALRSLAEVTAGGPGFGGYTSKAPGTR